MYRRRNLWVEADKATIKAICCAIKAQSGPGKKRKSPVEALDVASESCPPAWSMANQRWNIRYKDATGKQCISSKGLSGMQVGMELFVHLKNF